MVELESSSGNGLETPRATQLAKMANRMKISNGLRDTLRKLSTVELHKNYFSVSVR